ncbi:glutamate receptor 2.5-like [Salvia splendens]|uniref:glutamate receptor 2.5-like n=1 Tax=Salvia splendens TaxID=180675 RepID=UPI001C2628EA|nr:glutamate receptor 2.5-like [Salvia splendens]
MADRYVYTEFSQPYIESGLVMVVTAKPGLKDSKFIALNPFTKLMWLKLAAVSTATGFVIWFSEFATGNDQFTCDSILQTICSILWLPVTIIPLSQNRVKRERVTTMMTVPRLEPSVKEIGFLRNSNAALGCNGNSFICRYLISVLNFNPNNVKPVNSIDEYPRLFDNGEIRAAFFIAPHAKVFLAKYCNGYIVSGPSFKLGGFGFVR